MNWFCATFCSPFVQRLPCVAAKTKRIEQLKMENRQTKEELHQLKKSIQEFKNQEAMLQQKWERAQKRHIQECEQRVNALIESKLNGDQKEVHHRHHHHQR